MAMKLRDLWVIALCSACGSASSTADSDSVQRAIDESNAAHQKLCDAADRCYPSLQNADRCVLPSSLGTQGLERAGADDSTCVRAVLDAHPKEAAAVFDCIAAAESAGATCAQDCPEGKELDECVAAATTKTEGACFEPLERVLTRDEADALDACEASSE
jgi:hypothetical protein